MAPPAVAAPRGPVALPAPTDWLLWPFESTRVHPAWVEIGTATLSTGVFLLARALHDGGGNLARYAGVGLMSWLGAALVEPLLAVVLR